MHKTLICFCLFTRLFCVCVWRNACLDGRAFTSTLAFQWGPIHTSQQNSDSEHTASLACIHRTNGPKFRKIKRFGVLSHCSTTWQKGTHTHTHIDMAERARKCDGLREEPAISARWLCVDCRRFIYRSFFTIYIPAAKTMPPKIHCSRFFVLFSIICVWVCLQRGQRKKCVSQQHRR